MWLINERFVWPVLVSARSISPIESVFLLLVPLWVMCLLGFFLVFEFILNASAELTRFADRAFYGDWWNATTFDEWARNWNRPVHEYLLRHVYVLAIDRWRFSKRSATMFTFTVSNVIHEAVLVACFHKFHPWLSCFSFVQIPLFTVMRHRLFKGTQFGNIFVWIGLICGIPLIAVLYARDYCQDLEYCTTFDPNVLKQGVWDSVKSLFLGGV